MEQQTQQQLIQSIIGIVDRMEQLDSELFIREVKTGLAREIIDQGVSLLGIISEAKDITPIHLLCYSLYIGRTNNLVFSTLHIDQITPKFRLINCDEDTCDDCGTPLIARHEPNGPADYNETAYCNGCGTTYTN